MTCTKCDMIDFEQSHWAQFGLGLVLSSNNGDVSRPLVVVYISYAFAFTYLKKCPHSHLTRELRPKRRVHDAHPSALASIPHSLLPTSLKHRAQGLCTRQGTPIPWKNMRGSYFAMPWSRNLAFSTKSGKQKPQSLKQTTCHYKISVDRCMLRTANGQSLGRTSSKIGK